MKDKLSFLLISFLINLVKFRILLVRLDEAISFIQYCLQVLPSSINSSEILSKSILSLWRLVILFELICIRTTLDLFIYKEWYYSMFHILNCSIINKVQMYLSIIEWIIEFILSTSAYGTLSNNQNFPTLYSNISACSVPWDRFSSENVSFLNDVFLDNTNICVFFYWVLVKELCGIQWFIKCLSLWPKRHNSFSNWSSPQTNLQNSFLIF